MAVNRNHFIAAREREAVILLTVLRFLEMHAFLAAASLRDAKQRLQLLLMSTDNNVSMLPSLREQLDAARCLHHSLVRVSDILAGARQCCAVLQQRQTQLASQIARVPIRTAAAQEFIVRLFAFSREFVKRCNAFADTLARYVAAREHEARVRRAQEIRAIARRGAGGNVGDRVQCAGDSGANNNNTILFPFGSAHFEPALVAGISTGAHDIERAIQAIAPMSAAATPPARRASCVPDDADIYRCFAQTMERETCLRPLAAPLIEAFALCEHAHRVLQRDCQKLNEPLAKMEQDPDAYFREKAANVDAGARRDRLHKMEALIAFLDDGARLVENDDLYAYPKFSRELSATIREPRAAWQTIAADLLRAKVQAEGEIGAHL